MQEIQAILAERLAWEMESWNSIELRIRMRHTSHTGDGYGAKPFTAEINEHYLEAAAGKRMYEHIIHPPDGGERRSATYSDGKKCADVTYEGTYESTFNAKRGPRQRQVVIKRTFGNEGKEIVRESPVPLKYLHIDMTPLHKALAKAEHLEAEPILGRDCETFLFKNVRWNSGRVYLRYSLDKQTGIPLRVQCFADASSYEGHRPLWDWGAESFDEVDGYHLPLKSTLVAYKPSKEVGGPEAELVKESEWGIATTEAHFGRDYPDSAFWPVVQPGASVWDQIAGKSWIVPLPGGAADEGQASTVAQPIQATQPEGWTPTLSSLGLALGIAAIIASFIIRRNSRTRTSSQS